MNSTSTRSRLARPLIEGTCMRCPRCKRKQDILSYTPLMLIEEYQEETATIYKCPSCKWLFAPIDRDMVALLANAS